MLRGSRAAMAAVVAVFCGGETRAQTEFLGVAAGDASATEVVLWTRAVDPGSGNGLPLVLSIARDDPAITTPSTVIQVTTDPQRDHTAKVLVSLLEPDTRYYYRFASATDASPIGTFRTAPPPSAAVPVRFAFSGDCDGVLRPYPLANGVAALGLDFFVLLGDTVYESPNAASAGCMATGTLLPSPAGATRAELYGDYARKYREQFVAMRSFGQRSLAPLFAAHGTNVLFDNHEFGNMQYANGGAPAGGPVGGMPSGAGVDPRLPANDTNPAGPFMHQTQGFQALLDAFLTYQPVRERDPIVAPGDPRCDGARPLFFAQPWGRYAMLVSADDRSFRDIRMKTASWADETMAPRANNPERTMLGATQLAWLQRTLLGAEEAGVHWKFVALSTPIDQWEPLGGESGHAWIGGYRAERNALLRFVADHGIRNVVFLSTDSHQFRVNEVTYAFDGATEDPSHYVRVPSCIQIVAGPFGAPGPEQWPLRNFAFVESVANDAANRQRLNGVDPLGLDPAHPGLHQVTREGHPVADTVRAPVDFYSPDTLNFVSLSVSAEGQVLAVEVFGIDPTPGALFPEYDPVGNPVRPILSFRLRAGTQGTVNAFGAGCGQPPVSLLAETGSLPLVGAGFHSRIEQLPSSLAILAFGFSGLWIGATPLPLRLDGYGMIGCQLYHDLALTGVGASTAGAQGTVLNHITFPSDPGLVTARCYLQAFGIGGTSPTGISASNALALTLGLP